MVSQTFDADVAQASRYGKFDAGSLNDVHVVSSRLVGQLLPELKSEHDKETDKLAKAELKKYVDSLERVFSKERQKLVDAFQSADVDFKALTSRVIPEFVKKCGAGLADASKAKDELKKLLDIEKGRIEGRAKQAEGVASKIHAP